MTKRFVFNLQAVLERRAAIEEIEQRKVASLERERLAIEDRIRAYQRSISIAKDDLRAHLDSGVGPAGSRRPVLVHAVRMQAGASLHLTARAQQAVFELAGVLKRLELARAELLRAATARKAVELLRAKRFEEWRLESLRAEARDADEMSVMRHARVADWAGSLRDSEVVRSGPDRGRHGP